MMRTETPAAKARSTITVRRISPVETIEAVIPAKPGLVREVLASLPKPRTGRAVRSRRNLAREQMEYYVEGLGGESREHIVLFERERETNSRFRKLVHELKERHGDWASLTIKIKNTGVVDLTGAKPSASVSLDKAEWEDAERTFCAPIVKKNVKAVVILIRGGISEEERMGVFDRLCQQLPPMEAHLISEDSKATYTKIQVALFGLDISRQSDAFGGMNHGD